MASDQEIDIEIDECESDFSQVRSSDSLSFNSEIPSSHVDDCVDSLENSNEAIVADDCSTNKKNDERYVCLLNLEYSNERFYAFIPDELIIKKDDFVVVPTKYGIDIARVCGKVIKSNKICVRDEVVIVRLAEKEDFDKCKDSEELEAEAGKIFKEKVKTHNLNMKFIACHILTLESKILFFFSSEARVDFRLLVRDLVSIFKMRVELRQIGVRDETRFIGGIAPCGRRFCCNSITDRMEPVSIKMAKDEGMSLNSNRISGHCGRLLCCLAYEHKHYVEVNKSAPFEGTKINYEGETFKLISVNKITMIASLVSEEGRTITIPISRFKKLGSSWKIV